MPEPSRPSKKIPNHQLHPGSSADDARHVGGEGDFGVAEKDAVARGYVSRETKQSDPGAAQARAGTQGRTAGVGGNDSGPGSSSGGDLDPDFTGAGTGGGLSASGSIHEPPGPDDVTPEGTNGPDPAKPGSECP